MTQKPSSMDSEKRAVPLLALAQGGFSPAAFAHIRRGPEPLDDLATVIEQRDGPGEGPSQRAVHANDPVLEQFKRASGANGFVDRGQHLRARSSG